ncbi:MAG: methyltransferase domain-containing protein [Alphaproteobacteria bacterium]|nr:methyltransferase domain-containing protein [Alphaproteobacteria bacterium]
MPFSSRAEPRPDVAASQCADSPLDDSIAQQYGQWIYPKPAADLDIHSRERRDTCDPALVHRLFWPDRDYPRPLDILIAGCGANQAADIAYHNRHARVLGVDVSEPSLAHERHLRVKHGLQNLELLRLPIEELPTLGRDFDLILSEGVLHHMAEPLAGLKALASCLRRDGVIALYLYGRHGRVGVEILQSLFQRIGLAQDKASLAVVMETLDALAPEHPLSAAKNKLADLHFDAGIVDLFLNARERSYTVEDCQRFVADAGLVFQGWVENASYHPEGCLRGDHPLFAALAKLPQPEMWAATDLFHCNPGHFFVACRPDRPPEQYRIDFAGAQALGYVPVRRAGVFVRPPERQGEPARLTRHGLVTLISPSQACLLNGVDGRRSIRDILAAAKAGGLPGTTEEAAQFARDYFRSLWRMGLILVKLSPRGVIRG